MKEKSKGQKQPIEEEILHQFEAEPLSQFFVVGNHVHTMIFMQSMIRINVEVMRDILFNEYPI